MKKVLLVVVLFSLAFAASAEMKTTWREFDVQESLISDDYVLQKDVVLVVAKVNSNMDIKEYFISKKFTNESAYDRNGFNSLAFLFLDMTGKSKGFEVKPLFFSWDDYLIMEIPVGNYKLHSMLYPPRNESRVHEFELNDFLDYNFTMETPFVYIGDIKLLFDFENDFGVLEHRLLVEDNYLEAKAFLSEKIKDQNGDFLVLDKKLPDNNINLVFNIKEISWGRGN